jgi:hypothetical protein
MKRCVRGSAAGLRSGRVTHREGYCPRKGRVWSESTHASGGMSGKAWTLPTPSRAVVDLSEMAPRSSNSKPRRGELSRTCHSLPPELRLRPWNESRTNRARIADSGPVGIRSRQYVVALAVLTTKSCKRPVNGCKRTIGNRSPVAPARQNSRSRSSGDACRIIATSPSPCSVAAST